MGFPEYGNTYQFSSFESAVRQYWKKQKVFQRVISKGKGKKAFGFYDGPPFATGTPHYGHLLAGTIKDIIPRYWTMRGYHCERRFGWDCHGLPVEFGVEKELKLKGSQEIIQYGVSKFNEACRGVVLKYTKEWRETVERMGRWVDLDNDYKTMDPDFMESIWWVFHELWKKGLIYQGKKVVPYSWRITAPLSNFEAGLNYKSVQDPAISVLFSCTQNPKEAFLAWTTTPWTLPGNLALCVHPDLLYVKVKIKKHLSPSAIETVWILENRLSVYEKELDSSPLEKVSGKDLIGKTYVPLFPFYKNQKNAFQIIQGDFVTDSDGTGIVHAAPSFGEDDFHTCAAVGIEPVDPTDSAALFTHEAPPYEGKFVKDGDKDIIRDLKASGHLLQQTTIQHNYPYCYRSETPLIYKAISTWFVKMEPLREKMIQHNQSIHWVPSHLKDGRFGQWLANARDWCIARNRFWGTPIPVWICENCENTFVASSRASLEEKVQEKVEDLHSHFIDKYILDCEKCGNSKSMRRTPEILDCWFESGSMPYAQLHYPFENKEKFHDSYPADFIAEGLDQTRGWFYTLTVLAAALFDKPAFRNCVTNGIVMAEDGKKMSKSLNNYPNPNTLLDKHGADALRLYFMQSPGVYGQELQFSEKQLVEHMRSVLLPIWNTYNFFASYANIDGFTKEIKAPPVAQRPYMDRWILALLHEMEVEIHTTMEKYALAPVSAHIASFVDNLTNWYIRLNRSRFWAEKEGDFSSDKLAAYSTTWEVLHGLSKIMAPYLPFFSECLHASLQYNLHPNDLGKDMENILSVHETTYDVGKKITENKTLLEEMRTAQKTILLGRSLRSNAKISLRQPLQKITLAGLTKTEEKNLFELEELVRRELNIKEIKIMKDTSKLVIESVKPNLPRVGKRVGKKMGLFQKELRSWGVLEISAFEAKGVATVAGIDLDREDLFIHREAVEGKCAGALNGLVAELHTEITESLRKEGIEREIINRIQQRRKSMNFHLADRIQVQWVGENTTQEVLQKESKACGMISNEVLAVEWVEKKIQDLADQEKVKLTEQEWFAFSLQQWKEK